MHFPRFLGQAILLTSHGLLVFGSQGAHEILSDLDQASALLLDLKGAANLINPSLSGDFPLFANPLFKTGGYKTTQDKINAIVAALNGFANKIPGTTGLSATDTNNIITKYNNQFALNLVTAIDAIVQKACLFTSVPNVGAPFANSLDALEGAATAHAIALRNINNDINNGITTTYGVAYIMLKSAKKSYQGALCAFSG